MKKIIQRLSKRQILFGITGLAALLLGILLCIISNAIAGSLMEQQMASRWSEKRDVSQISCFFSREAGITENEIVTFEHNLDSALVAASITNDSENPGARLWADAYSATGKVTIESNRATVSVDAIGIGGDFFLFHPLKLLYGSYFSGNDLMQDYIVIDEDAAWQLFGSNDVAGQMVTISGIPHMIAGVVEREEGSMAKAAGLTSSIVYVSYTTLSNYGINYGLNTYEIVMPNPVSGYAKQYVMENIGVTEKEIEIVENTTRFSALSRLKVIGAFGTRSMSSKPIIYPYWENIARGYEDILGLLFVFVLLLFIYPTVLVCVFLIKAWKHKSWTVKSVYHKLKDKAECLAEKRRVKRMERKEARAGKEEKVYEKVK